MSATTLRSALISLGLVATLLGVGWGVWSNERIIAEGRVVFLELAPVDPRSLMQGDYMTLNYGVANQLRGLKPREDGYVIVKVDDRQLGRYVRHVPALADAPLATDEVAIRYRVRGKQFKFATNAFFFQEGHEPVFRGAKYGEFRIGDNGEPRLVALLDAQLKRLGENRF